jgi:hypothetical protein
MLRDALLYQTRTPQRIANGPDAIRAADAIRRAERNRDAWPFPHVYPPVNSMRRDPMGYCFAPAAAAQAVILGYTVPSGYWFWMKWIGLYYQGETFVPGGFLLTVDKNTPLGMAGFGSVLTDLQNIPFPLGSFEHGPIELPRTELLAPEDWLQAKVYNVSVTPGSPNTFGAYFGGWLVPTIEVPDAQ